MGGDILDKKNNLGKCVCNTKKVTRILILNGEGITNDSINKPAADSHLWLQYVTILDHRLQNKEKKNWT